MKDADAVTFGTNAAEYWIGYDAMKAAVEKQCKATESQKTTVTDLRVKMLAGGKDRVIPALRSDGEKIDKHTPGIYLRETLDHLGLTRPGLRWCQATRHTFASHWVLSGGSIEKLKEIPGHYSVVMTERYTHLRPDLWSVIAGRHTPRTISRANRLSTT